MGYTGNPTVDAEIQRRIDALATKDALEDRKPLTKSGGGDPPSMFAPQIPIIRRTVIGPGGAVELHNAPLFTYMGGDGQRWWDVYSPTTQARLLGQLQSAGLAGKGTTVDERWVLGDAWESVMGWANHWGVTPFNAIARLDQLGTYRGGGGGGGGGARDPVIEVPDYPTMAQNSKNMLRQTMGREIEDWEISLVADEMQRQYRKWADTKTTTGLSGGGIYEINDPMTLTQAFVEDEYESELDRLQDMGEGQANYNLVMQNLTQGAKLAGG